MSEQTDKLLSVEEFASLIGRSARTVFRYVSQGRIKSVTVTDIGRSAVRIPESEVVHFVGAMADDDSQWQSPTANRDSQWQSQAVSSSVHQMDRAEASSVSVTSVADNDSQWQPELAHIVSIDDSDEHVIVTNADTKTVRADDSQRQSMTVNDSQAGMGVSGHVTAIDILGRYEAAVMRLGYIEGELSVTRRMLGDGGSREAELRQRIDEAEREALKETLARQQAEAEAEALRQKLAHLESERQAAIEQQQRPWWQRWFS